MMGLKCSTGHTVDRRGVVQAVLFRVQNAGVIRKGPGASAGA